MGDDISKRGVQGGVGYRHQRMGGLMSWALDPECVRMIGCRMGPASEAFFLLMDPDGPCLQVRAFTSSRSILANWSRQCAVGKPAGVLVSPVGMRALDG